MNARPVQLYDFCLRSAKCSLQVRSAQPLDSGSVDRLRGLGCRGFVCALEEPDYAVFFPALGFRPGFALAFYPRVVLPAAHLGPLRGLGLGLAGLVLLFFLVLHHCYHTRGRLIGQPVFEGSVSQVCSVCLWVEVYVNIKLRQQTIHQLFYSKI